MSAKGVSDIIGCHKGRFFAIEVKAPGKIPTLWQHPIVDRKFFCGTERDMEQARFLDNVNGAGGIGFFADSVETVIEMLGLANQVKDNARR